ncbi:MAG: ABC transporter ATP-binding protein/permease [bacterium]|nr:ABC transporter ATP-binding protein/permease [bacterium]
MSDEKKLSLGEVWQINRRIFGICAKARPGFFTLRFAARIVEALSPYVPLYCSARFLNELAVARRPEMLTRWVLLILGLTAVLGIVGSVLRRMEEGQRYTESYWVNWIYGEKTLNMDFARADDARCIDQLSQILQTSNYGGRGIWQFTYMLPALIGVLFKVCGGIALSVSLFTLPVKPQYQDLPLLKVGLILAVGGIVSVLILSPVLAAKRIKAELATTEAGRSGNRFFLFYAFMIFREDKRALDIRMYRQDLYALEMLDKGNSWGLGGVFDQLQRGLAGVIGAVTAGLSQCMMGCIYLYVCLKAWYGAFGVGSVTQYVGALLSVAGGISELLSMGAQMRGNTVFLKQVLDYLDIPNEMYQGSLTVEKRSDRQYEVEFRDVSFRYPDSQEYALRHVNMRFNVGEKLAVVGQNGSGKTTFIKLLCRLYDPTEGEILLNGINIRKYDYQEYMSVFSVVFQDFQLLDAPLGENIAAGLSYDGGRAVECLEKAGLGEWYRTQAAKGLQTLLYQGEDDEEGIRLSGGEEQKLAIARSLYRDAPFLVLDEPTAALDPLSEYEIYTRLNEIVEDKTAIYISHRLSSCRFCDEIAVFHEGQVIEKGSHEGLLAGGGKYAELWNAQAQYYV